MRAAMADIPGIGNGAIVTVSATGRVGQVVRRRLGQTSLHDVGTYRVLKTPLRSHCTALDRASDLASALTCTRLCNDFLCATNVAMPGSGVRGPH